METPHLVIVGPMASGKSTLGAALAGKLGRPLRDSDVDLAGDRGITGRELAEREGVDALHRWESDHLARSLAGDTPSVVAAAASVVDDAERLASLAPHVVVGLTTRPEVLAARMEATADTRRRDLGADELAAVKDLARARDESFRAVADIIVDTTDRPAGEAVAEVLTALPATLGPPSRLSHVGICVTDIDRSLAFYRDGLGFEPTRTFSVGPEFGRLMEVEGVVLRSQFLRRDATTIELLQFESPGHTGDGTRRPVNRLGLTHLSVRVADVGAAAARIAQVGGVVLDGTRTTFGEGDSLTDFVYCTDPDGTRVELLRLPGPP
jgi:lactoylglutathione lyase